MDDLTKDDVKTSEIEKQETFPWRRGEFFSTYENILGHYIVKSIIENLRPPALLDLACGNGKLTSELAPYFERTVGVDASRAHIEKALKSHPEIHFEHCLAEEFCKPEEFSTITMITLLEHVQDPVGLLEQTLVNLSHEGVLIAHVPNAVAVNRRIARLMGSLADEYELSPFDREILGHRRAYDMERLVKDFEGAGLKIIKTGGVFYKMLSQAQIDWFLKEGPWESGGFGWGRVGAEKAKDWRQAFCDACYEFGKQRPQDCNIIYAVGVRK
ncbi:MAG: class I SAM-dependent methyltransferase [Desulfatibacillaceae bacterium]|nr:class I SAM-dependent methyltransferase [Desulfatibacillaceae bacterium]